MMMILIKVLIISLYQKQFKTTVYSKIILEEYTKQQLDEIGEIRLMDYDRRFDYSGMNLLSERYSLKK